MTDGLKPRIFKYDNVKLLAIVLVVIGSCAESFADSSDMFRSLLLFSYSFTAPLFVFLSGLFQKRYDEKRRPDIQKVTLYLLLGFLLKVLIFFVKFFSGAEPWFSERGADVGLNLLGGDGIEWYLFVIAGYMLLLYPLRKVNRYVMLGVSVVLGVAAGFLPWQDHLYFMRFFVFLPFYVAGYYLTPIKVRRFTHRANVKLAGIAFLFIYFVLCFQERDVLYPLRPLFIAQSPYAQVPIAGCTFWHRLLCYGISAVLIISVMACMPNRKFPVLTHLGRNTLGVYFWHYPIILLVWYGLDMPHWVAIDDPVGKYLLLVTAVVLALVLSIPVFTLPFRKLGALLKKLPTKFCLIADGVLIAAAVVLQLTLL